MLIVVDGSGEWDRARFEGLYMEENAGSFVWQLFSESQQAPKQYFPGPSTFGFTASAQAIEVEKRIVDWTIKYPKQKVFLAGHSRGGAICIQAAILLRHKGIQIECLVLFDAVQRVDPFQRRHGFATGVIPSNVLHVLHAIRDPMVGSRTSFGNTGLQWEGHPDFQPMVFFATHAGMGGTPGTGDHPHSPGWGSTYQSPGFGFRPLLPGFENDRFIRSLGRVGPKFTLTDDLRGSSAVKVTLWPIMKAYGMFDPPPLSTDRHLLHHH